MARLAKAVRDYLRRRGSLGGKARAAKYPKKTLKKWGHLGGRPTVTFDEDEFVRVVKESKGSVLFVAKTLGITWPTAKKRKLLMIEKGKLKKGD